MKVVKNNNSFIYILIICFIIFLYIYFKPHNYEKEYIVDGYKIIEKYDDNNYMFKINYNNYVYPFLINNNYLRKRSLIKKVEVYKNDDEICILPKSDYLNFYPLCNNKEEIYSYNNSNIEIPFTYYTINKNKIDYENIKINYLNNKTFFLYNYSGFYFINGNKQNSIRIFDNDVYRIDLIYQYSNYLLIADYNSNYYFRKFYLINMNNGKLKEINFEYDISFDSMFLGNLKNNIYILDKKEKKEYKININKNLVELVDYQIIENNKLVPKDYNDILNYNYKKQNKVYDYNLIDNKLYLNIDSINIRITDKFVNKIIKIDYDTVYYLENDNLYMYNNYTGEVLLMNYFEWNFNNINMIYFK